MDKKMKTTLIAVLCLLIIVSSFLGMQYVKSIYNQETIELSDVSFKVPTGFNYVDGSYEQILNDSKNETASHKLILRNQGQTIEFKQLDTTLQLNNSDVIDVNGMSIHENGTDINNQYFSFNFNGKGYIIVTPTGSDQFIKDIVNSLEVR